MQNPNPNHNFNLVNPNVNQYIRKFLPPNNLHTQHQYVETLKPEVLRLVQVLIRSINAKKILEIGTGFGSSAIAMQKFSNGHVDTIEKSIEHAQIALENIKSAGLELNINVIVGDSLYEMDKINKEYDFILLDGSKRQYPLLLGKLVSKLRKGGILVADNVLFKGMVADYGSLYIKLDSQKAKIVLALQEYLKEVLNHSSLITSILPAGDGIALSIKQ